ncbi:MAG: HD-GYP domain-containing protein [Dermatophilaceae bacterium]
MTFDVLWLLVLFVLVIAGESAHVRLTPNRGVSPIASAAAVALMLSLPHRPGLLGVGIVLAGLASVAVASLVGTAIAEAAGAATTGIDVLGRVSKSLTAGVLAQLIAAGGVEGTVAPDGRDWVYAPLLWLAALAAAGVRVFVVSLWVAWSERRTYAVALQEELASYGMLSAAGATTAVMIVLSREAVGLWGPFLFSLPLVLSIAAAQRYAQTRQTYRETIATLSRLTDVAGYTPTLHARRVADLSVALARLRGLSQRRVDTVEYAALLHDLGQVALDEPIPGGATVLAAPRDQDRIVADGVAIIRDSGVLDEAADVLTRQATPYRLMREGGERIPLESRIIKLANAFEDLTGGSREPGAVSVALERLQLGLGYEYDPELVDDLLAVLGDRGRS